MCDLLALFLSIILALKIIGISNAIRWMAKHGRSYVVQLKQRPPHVIEDYYDMFEANNGGFFPFGFKDYLLRRYLLRLKSRPWHIRAINVPVRIFQACLYRFERLSLITTVYCLLAGPLCRSGRTSPVFSHEASCAVLLILTILFVLTNIILSVEAVYAYGILGGYATPFHMISSEKAAWSGGSQFLLEIRVLIGKLVTTLLASASAFYITHLYFGALEGHIAEYSDCSVSSVIPVFMQSVYFSITTVLTVGYGDIQPSNGIGQFISFLVQLQSFGLLGLVLTSVSSVASQGRKQT